MSIGGKALLVSHLQLKFDLKLLKCLVCWIVGNHISWRRTLQTSKPPNCSRTTLFPWTFFSRLIKTKLYFSVIQRWCPSINRLRATRNRKGRNSTVDPSPPSKLLPTSIVKRQPRILDTMMYHTSMQVQLSCVLLLYQWKQSNY